MTTDTEIVHGRWPDSEAFYRERDHRTKLEVHDLHSYIFRQVEIHMDPLEASDITTQRIALVAANLTARWARRIRVVVPHATVADDLPGAAGETLSSRILREMSAADPFGQFEVLESPPPAPGDEALRLFVGSWRDSTDHVDDDYVVDASGWTARGRRGGQECHVPHRLATAPAAALAGAIGAGDLFKRAIQHPRPDWLDRFEWSTWSHSFGRDLAPAPEPPAPTSADVGRVLVAGVGAIGSALLYVLSLMPVTGRFTVVDRDQVGTSNLNRSPLFTAVDAARTRDKSAVAGALLRQLGIEVHEIVGTWREQGEPLSRELFDVWVSLTNEDAAWAEVPYQLPPVVVHGTTTSGWGVSLGRHIPRVEDCTLCRLPRPQAEFRGPCAEGQIGAQEKIDGPRASLPFLSTVAASLVASELIKLPLPHVADQPNAVEADFRRGLPAVLGIFRSPTLGCPGCTMAEMEMWDERGGRSRYAGLSRPMAGAGAQISPRLPEHKRFTGREREGVDPEEVSIKIVA